MISGPVLRHLIDKPKPVEVKTVVGPAPRVQPEIEEIPEPVIEAVVEEVVEEIVEEVVEEAVITPEVIEAAEELKLDLEPKEEE